MSTITLRIGDDLALLLKEKAKKEDMSTNSFMLKIIKDALINRRAQTHHDLDFLAGTWSKKDYQEFQKNTEMFETVDKNMW